MKSKITYFLRCVLLALISIVTINCSDESTSHNDDHYLNYFPLCNSITWRYEKISNTILDFDSLYYGATIDTVEFSLSYVNTKNDTTFYLFSRENAYDNTLFLVNDTIFCSEFDPFSEVAPSIFWKKNLELNERWKSWFHTSTVYNKPQSYVGVDNEVVNLDTTLSINNFNNKSCVILNKFYVHLISSTTEKWYFTDDKGVIRIDGILDFSSYGGSSIYRYDLINYSIK